MQVVCCVHLNILVDFYQCTSHSNILSQICSPKLSLSFFFQNVFTMFFHQEQIFTFRTSTFGLIWFSLCCFMTPGLRKDIPCHVLVLVVLVGPYFFKMANNQIRHQTGNTKSGLSTWWLHIVNLIFHRGLCGYVWVNTHFLTPEGSYLETKRRMSWPTSNIWWHKSTDVRFTIIRHTFIVKLKIQQVTKITKY